ncbi:MAG: hypothetical protein VR73_04085 [Gammaproteobacteria bacterium BRH_c0]|nr:MAG: hypothetical protein VR73_04085 [Gammaproteobacteria bacterium BRH_c0]
MDIQQSFAVSAPAGSGKTGLLIRRTLRLLADCEQPEQVLAITFTRKAAAEMHERIVNALRRGMDPTPPESDYERAIWEDARQVLARDEEHQWQLIASPSRLRIMTIDSLCRSLARQLAVETELGELPEPADQPQVYYREAVRNLFAELDKPGPVADSLALLLAHLDNNLPSLEGLLESLLAQREQWLQPILSSRGARAALEDALQQTVQECLQATRSQLLTVAGEIGELCDYAAANLHHLHLEHPLGQCLGMAGLPATNPDPANLAHWQAVTDLFLTQAGGWRAKVDKRVGFPTKKDSLFPDLAERRKDQLQAVIDWCKSQPGLLEQLEDLRNLPAPLYSDNQWQLLEALTVLLPRLVGELSLLFQERRSCDFTEITLAALNALGEEDDPTELSLKLDYQIRHILVDEFQDTSSLQFNLFKKLINGWQAGDGRTLFIVGDGMQSLYGFRNANVGLFLEARAAPVNNIELIPLDLAMNFRSDPKVVEWVNQSFRHVFPQRQDVTRGAVPYSPALAAKDSAEGCAITLDIFEQPADPADEALVVVEHVQRALALNPQGSIAILTRARSHLQHILGALYQAGIPWEATDIDPLASRMPVIDLLSLTRALLNPADRIAWLSVLRAPWCGLDLKDLHSLVNAGRSIEDTGDTNFPWLPGQVFSPTVAATLSPQGQAALERTAGVLKAAWDNRLRKPLRLWVEGAWLALGGPATLISSNEMAWCQQFFDLLESHAQGASLADAEAFENAVGKLYAAPDHSHPNPVQVMTIHKSKGLEFDTVLIPGLHRGGGKNDSTLLYWRERINEQGESQLLIAPPLSPREQASTREQAGKSASQLVRHLKQEKTLKSRLEDARVLYVGCTRAIRRLHLLFTQPAKSPAAGSLLASLWPAFAEGFGNTGATVFQHPANAASSPGDDESDDASDDDIAPNGALNELMRLVPTWQNPFLSQRSDSIGHTAHTPEIKRDSNNHEARHTGTILHRTLRRMVLEGVDTWNPERIARQVPAWELQLRALGLVETGAAVAMLRHAVSSVLNDPTGRWLLDHRHAHSACELALGHSASSGDIRDALPQTSIIDRCFEDKGVLWIIDYKTAQPLPGESLDAFTARQQAEYREQLERYKAIMANRHNGEIRTALYFPLIPHFAPLLNQS